MKAGIMTFQASHNCGSMLQAYALQHTLETRYGIQADLIDFANSGSRNMYGMFDFRFKKQAIHNNINNIKYHKVLKQYHSDYEEFKKLYLKTTDREFKSTSELQSIVGDYDIFVSGGDQVWNVKCPDADEAYFLSFANGARKVSYSPSLGGININETDVDLERYRNFLLDYEKISVREPNGQKWIQELTGLEVPIIADPVFLLSHEEWLNQFDLPVIEEKYIFNYAFFHNRVEANNVLMNVSKETGLPVYVLDTKSWAIYRLDQYGIKHFSKTGPLAFISLMENAEMVFTQSFHGTVFAAMFHKQFWSYRAPSLKRNNDDRATAILDQLGLRDRYVVIDDIPQMDYQKKIDFTETDLKIEKLRSNAFEYLDSIFLK